MVYHLSLPGSTTTTTINRYLDYVRKLSFSSQPDYKYLQSLFKKVATMQNVMQSECKFDWASTKPGIMQQQASSESNNISIKRDDPISLLLMYANSSYTIDDTARIIPVYRSLVVSWASVNRATPSSNRTRCCIRAVERILCHPTTVT